MLVHQCNEAISVSWKEQQLSTAGFKMNASVLAAVTPLHVFSPYSFCQQWLIKCFQHLFHFFFISSCWCGSVVGGCEWSRLALIRVRKVFHYSQRHLLEKYCIYTLDCACGALLLFLILIMSCAKASIFYHFIIFHIYS